MTVPAQATMEVVIANGPGDSLRRPEFATFSAASYACGPTPTVADTPGRAEIGYLRHICENYDRLADVTVFLPGDAVARYPWIPDRVRGLPKDLSFCAFGKELLVEDIDDLPCGPRQRFGEICADWSLEPPDFVACHAGSMFAVARRRIVSRPRRIYQRTLERASSHLDVAELLERLWHLAFAAPASRRGIVTAGDTPIFRDLQFLILSLEACNDVSVVVYDLGLATHELQWCLSQPNVTCRPLPPLTRAMTQFVGSHRWQAWLKPAYILDAPFDRILWLDADCVVLDSVADAFSQVEGGPFLLPEVCPGSGRNHPRLYESLPIADCGRQEIEINNGVIGLDRQRDRALLDAWLYAVEWAVRNEGHRHLMRWYDQGALLWAISKTRLQARISTDQTWNYPAKPVSCILGHAVRNHRSVLASIRDVHPEARVVHWFGLNKLSVALDREVRELFVSRAGLEEREPRSTL